MIWAGRRYHLEGDMTPLAGMSLLPVGYIRVLLAWSSIQRPSESVMLWIRGDKKQKNMSAQNFKEISKSMEADEIMKMVEDAFRHRCFIIYFIVSDYGSTI